MYIGSVNNEDNLFFDNNRGKRQAEDFEPRYLEDLEITEAQRMTCENNDECIYDLVITGDNTVALTTLNDQKEENETYSVLSKC